MGFDKSYVCQWHLPLINYERMKHLQSTRRRVGEERSSGGRAPSDLTATEATGACDSPSLETAGLWSLGLPSGLRMEIFLSLIRRKIFLADRYRQRYFTAYGVFLTTLARLWDKCQLQDIPSLSSGNSFSYSSCWD